MTDGSSQGLFIIVGVVIFGLFVVISYSIFRGTLQPSLANIFNDSTSDAVYNLKSFTKINSFKGNKATLESSEKGLLTLYDLKEGASPTDPRPTGIRVSENIIIPYNHKINFYFEIYVDTEESVTLSVDLNSYPVGESVWNPNDNFGESSFANGNMFFWEKIKGKQWHKGEFWYANNSEQNKNKVSIQERVNEGTVIGIQGIDIANKNVSKIFFKNISYKITPL